MHAVDSAAQKLQFKALARELETHKRLERELTEAKQAAEAAMMAKGEFLATMSHEIRTPLNGILPMLDMLRGSRLTPEQQELLNVAHTSARQLLRIVDDILDYSKLEANRLELELVAFNLREMLDSVIRLMAGSAEKKGVRLLLRFDERVRPVVRGDPTRLRQVLTNLVSNAIKFTEKGSVTVSVARLEDTRTHQSLRFEVRDTGIGIPAEKLERLFTPFSQADAATTRLYGGTGLGLAISRRIMDLMGGHIGADSEPGTGSRFWFELALLKAVGDIEGARIELGGAHVLVLSADPALQRRLGIALGNWGVRVQQAGTTQEALDLLRAGLVSATRQQFHLVLADLASIRTTAVALHRNIRREPELDALRVVYLQGREEPPLELIEPERVRVVPRTLEDAALRVQLSEFLAQPVAEEKPAAPVGPPQATGAATEMAAKPMPSSSRTASPVAAPPTHQPPRQRISGRVLLVEDNPVNRMVAQRLLGSLGLDCDTASDGRQALEAMARERYDLVLMDCLMPAMDGYSAARAWRERERGQGDRRLPIVAMTANAMAGDRQACLDAGMDDYLSKPVVREALLAVLQRWLPESGAGPAAEPAPAAAPVPVAAPARERAPALDPDMVEDLRQIMGQEFERLVQVFLEDSPGHLLTLQAAAVAGDVEALVGPAHSLKSASANLGAIALSEQAREIEHSARGRRLDNPMLAVTRLCEEHERVEQALRALLDTPQRSLT